MKITDKFPKVDDKYLCLENNKTYKSAKSIKNLLYTKYNMTLFEYAVKWDLIGKEYYVNCKICGVPCDSIGKHLSAKHKGYGGIKEYKKIYGEDNLLSEKYAEYLKNKMLGDNNHNHKSNTTELQRQQKSPFSIEFWKLKYPKYDDVKLNELLLTFRESALSDREFNTRLEYYTSRGYSEAEGLELLRIRQTTFSLAICEQKYGKEKGLQVWKERQEKWLDSLLHNGNLTIGYSRISQELFDGIKEQLPNNNFKYATHNDEIRLCFNSRYYLYDFADIDNKKVIEFQGDLFHGNPEKFKADDFPHPFRKDITAQDMWDKDKLKYDIAINNGYDVLIIWESEYRDKGIDNKNKVIQRCIDFIKS